MGVQVQKHFFDDMARALDDIKSIGLLAALLRVRAFSTAGHPTMYTPEPSTLRERSRQGSST